MRVVLYDELGGVALDYYTRQNTVALCPGRLEKEAALFVIDGPAPTPERRNFRQHVYEGDQGE